MIRRWHIGFGVVLTALAGFVDAIGFIRLGGLYTSLMSGNMTQAAVALGHGEPHTALLPALLILAFFVGAAACGVLSALAPQRWGTSLVLAFETIALGGAFALGELAMPIGAASLVLALAMGAQNAVLAQVQGFRAGTTFVTGALFAFSQKFALALAGRGPRFGWVGDGAVWFALFVGAIIGTVAHALLDIRALMIPAVVTGTLCMLAVILTIRAGPDPAA